MVEKTSFYYELKKVQENDEVALVNVIDKIMPIINKYSKDINGIIDGDLKSTLIEHCIRVTKKMDIDDSVVIPKQGVVSASSNAGEAVNALTVLGYSPTDAAAVVAKFDSALPVEELIRLSLKAMAGKM